MSLSTQPKPLTKELKTGIHLILLVNAWETIDVSGNRIHTHENESPLTIQFMDGKGKIYENDYLIQKEDMPERQLSHISTKAFKKLCLVMDIDLENPKFKTECGLTKSSVKPKRRGYIFIREVHDIDGDVTLKDVNGNEIVNYWIFDYAPFVEGKDKPVRIGDPETSGGIASGDFIDYRQINPIEKKVQEMTAQEKIALGKKLIAKTMNKSEWDLDAELPEVKPLPIDPEFEARYGANMSDAMEESKVPPTQEEFIEEVKAHKTEQLIQEVKKEVVKQANEFVEAKKTTIPDSLFAEEIFGEETTPAATEKKAGDDNTWDI